MKFQLTNPEWVLRRLLWMHHGCPLHALYGDDGELQCNACLIDFKRNTAQDIDQRLFELGLQRYNKAVEGLRLNSPSPEGVSPEPLNPTEQP